MNINDVRRNASYHRIGEFNLFIIPALPSWVVLTDEEAIAFDLLLKEFQIDEIISKLSSERINKEDAVEVYKKLITKLTRRGILSNNLLYIAPDADKYPTNIHLILTHHCNLRCRHCYIKAGNKQIGELELDDWINGFNNLFSVITKPDITISGGEPTTVEFIPELICYLKEKGKSITFYTNGLNQVIPNVHYINEVQISLEGLSERTHDYIRGKGTYENVSNFILKFPDKNKLKIALTIMHHNFEEIRDNLPEWLVSFGLKMSNMRLNAELEIDGRAKKLPDEFHTFQYKNAIEIFKFISKNSNKIDDLPFLLFKNMRNCGIGISIGVDANGDIYPCDSLINKQGNILDHDIEEIIKKCLSINKYTEIDKIIYCTNCDLKYICLGGCKAKNLKINGSYLKPACDQKSRYIKYVQMIFDVGL